MNFFHHKIHKISAVLSASVALTALTCTGVLASFPIDTSFGTNGIVELDPSSAQDSITDIAIQTDGKVVVVGTMDGGDSFIARFEGNGSLDTSFGSSGIAFIDVPGGIFDTHTAVVIQSTGKIVVAGQSEDIVSGIRFAYALRVTSTGILDTSFGTSGFTTFSAAFPIDTHGMSLDGNGKIQIVGRFEGPNDDGMALRMTADGELDPTWDGDGVLAIDTGSDDELYGVTAQADGKVLLVGKAYVGGVYTDQLLARRESNGSADSTFGAAGMVLTDFYTRNDVGMEVGVNSDGTIVVGGVMDTIFHIDPVVTRYSPTGGLDTSFGSVGFNGLGYGGDQTIGSMSLQSDGSVYLFGYAYNGSSSVVIAKWNSSGYLDSTFNDSGVMFYDPTPGDEVINAGAVTTDGHIYVAGHRTTDPSQGKALLARLGEPTLTSTTTSTSTSTSIGTTTTSGHHSTTTTTGVEDTLVITGIGVGRSIGWLFMLIIAGLAMFAVRRRTTT